MPLLAKALYKFGFFWRNFVIIVKTIRRITLGYIFSWIWFFFQELHHRQSELADDQRIQNLGWSGRMPLDKIWNHPTSRKWRHVFQNGGHFWRGQQHLPQRFVSSIGNKDIIILSHWPILTQIPKYILMTELSFFYLLHCVKVHIFWEGHKILQNLPLTFVLSSASQK